MMAGAGVVPDLPGNPGNPGLPDLPDLPDPPGHVAGALLVASMTFRDLARRPGGWIATLLTAMLFALLVAALGLSGDRAQTRAENRSFKIAIGGDLEGARQVLEEMSTPRLVFAESDQVSADVTESRASAGIEFPPDTDRRLASGDKDIEVRMYQRQSANGSNEAFNTLGVRLQEVELSRWADAQGQQLSFGEGPDITTIDLPRDERLNRLQTSRQLAPIAALLCIGVVTSVAAILGAARERRSIEPLLVLPITRRSIALGIALGAYPLACLQIVAAVILLVMTVAIPGSAAHQPPATVVTMLAMGVVASLVLALVATGFGCLAGALGTGSDDAVSLGDLVSVLFVVVGVVVFSLPTMGAGSWPYAVPILGQILLMRDLVNGSFAVTDIVLAVASAGATFALLVRTAGGRLDEERRLGRATR
jgi:ABC-type Na+ efflux pump permease subunit